MSLSHAVVEFVDSKSVRFVSRHRSARTARDSAESRGLSPELNVLELHTGDMPDVGDMMSRAEMKSRFKPVPLPSE